MKILVTQQTDNLLKESRAISLLRRTLFHRVRPRGTNTAVIVSLGFPLELQLQPFLTIGTRYTWVLRATMGRCAPVEGAQHRYSWDRRQVDPKLRSGHSVEENLYTVSGFEPRFFYRLAVCIITTSRNLARSVS